MKNLLKKPSTYLYVVLAVVVFGFTKIEPSTTKIMPCPVCGADGYLHKAINDVKNPAWAVDCTVYDKKGSEHERVGKIWLHCKEDAIMVWNNYR